MSERAGRTQEGVFEGRSALLHVLARADYLSLWAALLAPRGWTRAWMRGARVLTMFAESLARAEHRPDESASEETGERPDLERRFDGARDIVEEGSWESFPASDPPSTMPPA